MLIVLGGNGNASMSATEWIGASQVMRSRCGSRTASVSASQRGILDPRLREAFRDQAVEHRVRRVVDDRALVLALEVEGVHPAHGRQLGDELGRPLRDRIELEPRPGMDLEQLAQQARSTPASRRRSAPAAPSAPAPRPETSPPAAARDPAPRSRAPSAGSRGTPPSPAARGRARDRRVAARRSRASTRRPAAAGGDRVEAVVILHAVDDVLAEALLPAAP